MEAAGGGLDHDDDLPRRGTGCRRTTTSWASPRRPSTSSVRYLAWDLGQKNIRVNAVSAGPVTALAARSIAGFPTMEAIVEERALRSIGRSTAADVGAAGAFLLSDEAANITGTILYVDSGYHAMGYVGARAAVRQGAETGPYVVVVC